MAKRANRGSRPNPSGPSPEKRTDTTPQPQPAKVTSSTARLGSVQAAKERQEKRKQEQRRTQQTYLFGGIVAVAIVIAVLFFSVNQPAEAPIPTDEIARYEDIPANWKGQDEEGFPRLGDPQAPVKVVEFASFGCPGCAQLHRDVYPQLLDRVKRGDISFTYVPLLTGEGNVTGAARVGLCADDQGKFWEAHDTLFSWHNLYGANAFNQNRLTTGVRALGLNEGALNSCVNSDPITNLINIAQGKGVDTTPTVRVNNSPVQSNDANTILAAIDSALAASGGPRPTTVPASVNEEPTSAATSDATAEAEATSDATTEAEATSAATQDATAEATEAN